MGHFVESTKQPCPVYAGSSTRISSTRLEQVRELPDLRGSPAGMTSAIGYTDFALGTIALALSLQMEQLKTGTLMAEGNAALLSHYGILVRRRSPEAAWALTFPTPPGGKPA